MRAPLISCLRLSRAVATIIPMAGQTTLEQVGQLHRRRITLADGRYLIFYTFDDEGAQPSQVTDERQPQPEPEPLATEENGV